MCKNYVTISTLIFLLIISTGYGQRIDLRGRVVDQDKRPVKEALVRLMTANQSQKTDDDGRFHISVVSVNKVAADPALNIMSFQNGILTFNVSEKRQKIEIEVFNNRGQSVNKITQERVGIETHTIKVLPDNLPITMYFIKMQIGKRSSVFKAVNFKNIAYSMSGKELSYETSMVKQYASISGTLDVLEVSKDKFKSNKKDVYSYTTDLSEIVLESNESVKSELPPIKNGSNANTTRYWDCCKPHCGWHSNMRMCDKNGKDLNDKDAKSSCEGGPAYQCLDYAPFAKSGSLAYGWAAFNNGGTTCGDCFQLDFQGSLNGKQMIVQVINIGDGGQNSFDLLIPGGGVGQFNGCSQQWNNAPVGQQYGGFHSTCNGNADCIRKMCQKAFGDKRELMQGCEWYLDWFKTSNNPKVVYKKVSCPDEIKSISRIGN